MRVPGADTVIRFLRVFERPAAQHLSRSTTNFPCLPPSPRSLEPWPKVLLRAAIERFLITWAHVIKKEELNFNELEHVRIEKAGQLFRDML
jgi:hypothetical protein